jgi:hypothetical protein
MRLGSLLLTAGVSYGTKASIDDLPQEALEKVDASVQFLQQALDQGRSVYGTFISNMLSANAKTVQV